MHTFFSDQSCKHFRPENPTVKIDLTVQSRKFTQLGETQGYTTKSC